jgi:hypothetical protein
MHFILALISHGIHPINVEYNYSELSKIFDNNVFFTLEHDVTWLYNVLPLSECNSNLMDEIIN